MPRSGSESRARWRAEGKCSECGSSDANGQYRCERCVRGRTARKQAKVRGELAKVRPPRLKEAHHDVTFWLATNVAKRLTEELRRFQIVFTHGSVQGQRLSGLLRGYAVHGIRTSGLPTLQEVNAYSSSDVTREQVTASFTDEEYSELAKLSEPYNFKLTVILSLVVEREATLRLPIPHTPKLDGLRGGVVLVKNWNVQRIPSFLYTKETPILTGYTSLRDLINLPPEDGIGEFPEPERNKIVRVHLSEDEYQSFEVLRKQYFKHAPTRSALFREMFYEIADQRWFDLQERYDRIRIENSKTLDRMTEFEKKSKKDRKRAKRYWIQRDRALALVAELADRFVVQQAALMELGKYSFDEDTVKTAESILKSWDAFGGDLKSLYSTLSAREIESVASMMKEEKRVWRDQQMKALEELVRRSRETTRLLLGGDPMPEQKKLNGAANGSPLS